MLKSAMRNLRVHYIDYNCLNLPTQHLPLRSHEGPCFLSMGRKCVPCLGQERSSFPLAFLLCLCYKKHMLKMFTYRLYPTKKQEKRLNETLEECRWLYNHLLEMRKTAYERDGISLTCFQQQYTFPVLKQERLTLNGVHSQVMQNVAVRVDLAFKAFFRRVREHTQDPGYPRFKGFGRYDSFSFPQSGFSITPDERVTLS